jgi:large subunit ribosomal protein L10
MAKLGKIPQKRRGRVGKAKTQEALEKMFSTGDGAVFFDNHGLTVQQVTKLRASLRQSNCAVKVAKNTLIGRALEATGHDPKAFEALLKGPTVVAIGLEDPVSAAKGIKEFMKSLDAAEKQPMAIKGGMLEGKVLDAAGVDRLAAMPGREEMISMLLGSLQAPAQNMAYALNASVSQFAWALNAYKTKLEEAA